MLKRLFTKKKRDNTEQFQEIVQLVGQQAEKIFREHKLCCAESVMVVLNQAFGGDLTPEMALRLGSGFCHGMGGAGCTCGALAGAEMVLSLFLGPHQTDGMKNKKFEKVSKEMHDRFKSRFDATCCRILTKRRKEKRGASCKELTIGGAEIVTELLLETRPELAGNIDMDFLKGDDSTLSTVVKKLAGS